MADLFRHGPPWWRKKRGDLTASKIFVPTGQSDDGGLNVAKCENIVFEGKLFTGKELSGDLRHEGTHKLFQCLNTLYPLNQQLTFVEVGACTGKLVKSFLLYDPDTKAYCIEPNSYLVSKLKEELPSSVNIENIGFGAKRSNGFLYITEAPQYSSQYEPNTDYENTILKGKKNKYKDGSLKVNQKQSFDILTGDEYFKSKGISRCDVLSINTQGTEIDVLKGLSNCMGQGLIKAIKVEVDFQYRYHGQRSNQLLRIEQIMAEFGYRIFEILHLKHLQPAGIQLLDILYVHNSIDMPR